MLATDWPWYPPCVLEIQAPGCLAGNPDPADLRLSHTVFIHLLIHLVYLKFHDAQSTL